MRETWAGNRGIHALREDFCRLPLTSELDALCATNANPNEKIQRGRLTKEDAVGYSCTTSKKSPFDQL